MKKKINFFNLFKPWIYSKFKIIFFFIIITKKKKIKNKIIYNIFNSKNTFFYEYSPIINQFKNMISINILKIKNKNKKNIIKIEIIEIILKNNIIYYRIKINNEIRKIKNIYFLIKNKILWEKKLILYFIILIILNIKESIISVNNKNKIEMSYKICGKILNKINIIKTQQINGMFSWIIKTVLYIINIIYIYILLKFKIKL